VSQAVLPTRTTIGRIAGASFRSSALFGSQLVLFAVSYYLAARLGLGFRFQSSQIGVVWPANAVLLSALLLTPRARWWAVLAASALAHMTVMAATVPAWRWGWQIIGNSIFTTATAEILRRTAGFPLHFGSRRQVLTFTGISFLMPTLFAFTTPAFVRALLRLDPVYTPPDALLRVILTNATAILLIVPVVLLWKQYGLRRLNELPRRVVLEAAVIVTSVLAVGMIAFGTGPEIARFPSLLLWIFPPLIWAAVRLGPVGAATSLFCIAALSVWGTAEQLGPFVLTHDADQVVSLQLFWVVLCPPVMLLAAVIHEREVVEDALHEQRDQLAHVTRVATAGELSGALAHELRQPLMSILANAQAGIRLLEYERPDLHEVREILNDIVQHDRQAAGVIARLRSFVREGESHFDTLVVETVVRDALALSRSTVELSQVEVQTQIAPGLPRVRGDPVQLLQVMLNLIVNGCESMSGAPVSERRLRLAVAQRDEDHVEVSVSDCGVGLPEQAEDRVFQPFYTTKEKGLGLGLAIGRSIVTAHGGQLWAENNPQRGATFHLLLTTDNANGRDPAADRDR
jgi:signal transduction histidine kinase